MWWCCLCCLFGTLLLIYPGIMAAVLLVRTIRKGKKNLEEDVLPNAKAKAKEAVRVRRRRHWEKTHPEEMAEETRIAEEIKKTITDTENGTE